METNKKASMEKMRKPKSPTRYPKRMPSYVVAFAAQETLDDPQKLEQVTDKRSSDSTNTAQSSQSLSPTDSTSTKTFTITPTEKLSGALNVATLSEVKIDILDENQCGDVTEKKSSQLNILTVISQKTIDEQPEIIFNAPKHIKRCKDNNKFLRKKSKKTRPVIKFTNVHFKYKKPRNSMTRRLERYYETTKSNSEQVQKQIYCNDLSQVVSRTRVLQKVLAKENLLADSERISSYDGEFANDGDSLNSSPSRSKKSFISYTSQKTCVYKDSLSSRNADEFSENSNIQMTSDKQGAYKSEALNVSVAINHSKTYTNETVDSSSNEKLVHKENLTSSEILLQDNAIELTSKPTSSDEPKSFEIDYSDLSPVNLDKENKSNDTITPTVKPVVEQLNEDDSFVIARTSSDFGKTNITSNSTFHINSGTTIHSENVLSSLPTNDNFSSDTPKNTTLLERVITLGFYPINEPSVGSSSNINYESNSVLVTDNVKNCLSFTRDTKSVSEDRPTDAKKVSILRKPVERKNMNYLQNNFCLPDDVTIKNKLNEKEEVKVKTTCAEEVRNSADLDEIWERVAFLLDVAVKRLEETLTDKIVSNIRESLAVFNQSECKVTTSELRQRDATTTAAFIDERPIPTMLHKEIFVKEEHLIVDADECVQCDLVQKHVIDQLMFQLGLVPKPIPPSDEAVKIVKPPELLKDYTEVLKPPVAHVSDSVSVEEGKGDTVTVSTATTEFSTTTSFRRLKRLVSCPMSVFRENMVIFTSVPTFFIVLFCLYGVIVVVMKPW